VFLSAHNAATALRQAQGVVAHVALEWEWYVRSSLDGSPVDEAVRIAYLDAYRDACRTVGLDLHSCDAESGVGQVEAALFPSPLLDVLVIQAQKLHSIAHEVAERMGYVADFSAKPFAHDYGSAIHIHIHLEDEDGALLYTKQDDVLSVPLQHSLAGLLASIPDYLDVFVPTQQSRKRLVAGFHAPVNASWGYNNRTTALRIPDGVGLYVGQEALVQSLPRSPARRIEHRLAGADANIEHVIAAVISGVAHGLEYKLLPPEPIYGDASLAQYGLACLLKE
jgi:glutamine synthetase